MPDPKPVLPCMSGTVPHEEALAALEHQQWCHWAEHMISCLREEIKQASPQLVEVFERLPSVMRWRCRMVRPYYLLTEDERESDRVEVRLKRPGYLASTKSDGPTTLEERYMTVADVNTSIRNKPLAVCNIPPPPPAVPSTACQERTSAMMHICAMDEF